MSQTYHYRTYEGLIQAAERMALKLESEGLPSSEDEKRIRVKFNSLERQLAQWFNPQAHEMIARLNLAWTRAMEIKT